MAEKQTLGLASLQAKAQSLPQGAASFIQQAQEEPATPSQQKTPLLVVHGNIKDRAKTCQAPTMVYLSNDVAEWIGLHSMGTGQVVINTLIREGIKAVEQNGSTVFVEFEQGPVK